jgi:uncharacterized protein HemX
MKCGKENFKSENRSTANNRRSRMSGGPPGAGAAIGGVLGLGAGALVRRSTPSHENINQQQQQQIQANQAEVERQQQSCSA